MALRNGEKGTLGLYIHVPFCLHKCNYCDFTAYIYRPKTVTRYLEALAGEALLAAGLEEAAGATFTSIFFGGGTPTALAEEELARLFRAVTRPFHLGEEAEVTVEANPETLSVDKLRALRELGVNRLSIGLQVWDDTILAAIGRRHTGEGFLAAFRAARRAGFTNLAVDLIYGLPGQTPASWRETLARVIDLEPEHVSAYSLQIEEGTPFFRWFREGRLLSLPEEDTVADMYALTQAELAAAGYEHYEISNFARPGYRSRHNQVYWRNEGYLGLGPAAASHLGGVRRANVRRLDEYAAAVAAARLPVAEVEAADGERQMRDTLMLGLRLLEGVSLTRFRNRFGIGVSDRFGAEVTYLREAGLLEQVGDRLRLTERALPVANLVFREFV